ncbi:MAG: hypothetical protein ACRD1H_17100, partial [Vicinamibacterales bacterium]
VQAREIFGNCPRYIHQYQLIERSRFVPRANCETPVPEWKQRDTYADVLPERDRERVEREAAKQPGGR